MRICLVIALTLAVFAGSSAYQRFIPLRCRICQGILNVFGTSSYQRFISRRWWICRECLNISTFQDKCTPDPCKNGGECQPGDGSCICTNGFYGRNCQVLGKCIPDPCKNGGQCKPEDGSCFCAPGFSGPTCEVQDKCLPDPCKNGGQCQPVDGSCVCTPGFTGPNCQNQISPCPVDEYIKCKSDCPKIQISVDYVCDVEGEVCCDPDN